MDGFSIKDDSKVVLQNTYVAELFTQLVINRYSPIEAMEIAVAAGDKLKAMDLPFISIKVG